MTIIIDEDLKPGIWTYLEAECGYSNVREIDGKICGLQRMLFTVGVFIGMDEVGYDGRFCFDTWQNAALFLKEWDGKTLPTVGDDGCKAIKYWVE